MKAGRSVERLIDQRVSRARWRSTINGWLLTALGEFWQPVDDDMFAGALFGIGRDGRAQAVGQFHLARANVVETVQIKLLRVHHTVAICVEKRVEFYSKSSYDLSK